MKPDAVPVYACPSCKGGLRLEATHTDDGEVLEGTLHCVSCPASYPIVGGVPRFTRSGQYAESFGQQWNWFRHVQLDSFNGTAQSRQALFDTTGWEASNYAGKLLLDAGVGAGRFAECAAAQGARVFGIDLTHAVDAAFGSIGRRPNVNLAQADIFALPFRDRTFDLAYSIGVLHHTPDPQAAFGCVASTVSDEGELAVYLYARYGVSYRSGDLVRTITTRLPTPVVLGLSAAAVPAYFLYRVPVVGTLLRFVFPISEVPDWRWRWLDTFDCFAPKYQFKYLYPEIFRWFETHGFHDVTLFDGPIRMRGRKAAQRSADATEYLRRVVAS